MLFKKLSIVVLVQFVAQPVLAQSSPNFTYKQVPTPGQWNAAFAAKQDYLGYTPANRAGDVFLGPIGFYPSTATGASVNIPPGAAPIAPNNGDVWETTSGFWLRINNSSVNLFGGTSVNNPGTGTLEALVPIQTFATPSKTFDTADLFYETRRSNSGAAMTDTFPAATTTGLVNGTRIVVANVDSTASDTITAGSGTSFSSVGGGTSSTDVVGPNRAIQYVYDKPNLVWRRTLNTGTALLSPNNLSDVANPTTALNNLGGIPQSALGTSGHAIPYLDGNNTFSGTNNYTVSPTVPTPPVGDNSTKAVNSSFVLANSVSSAILRGYLGGLNLSNDSTTPNTVLDISAGVAQGSDNATLISLGAFTKSIGGAWASGSGSNGMGNGLTAAASTWYHVCLAYNAGSPDIYFDTSVTCANKPAGISGTIYRRLGSFKTDASIHILAFTQFGDQFWWTAPVADYSTTTLGTTPTLVSLSVPSGLTVNAQFIAQLSSPAAGGYAYIYSPLTNKPATSAGANIINPVASQYVAGEYHELTNASQQIDVVAGQASTNLSIETQGWVDTRGRFN